MFPFIIANYPVILAAVFAVYEVVVRLVPTVKNWSILSGIISVLKWVSDTLNNKK